jgi:hypothetical protein
MSFEAKLDWIQRWAAACGALNHCESCADKATCQSAINKIIARSYTGSQLFGKARAKKGG